MKKWFIASMIPVILIVTGVMIWPRSVRCDVRLKNATGVTVRVTVRRVRPRPSTVDYKVPVDQERWLVYRYSKGQLARTREHVITVAVDAVGGGLLTTAEFRGSDIYGKTLIIRRNVIDIVDR